MIKQQSSFDSVLLACALFLSLVSLITLQSFNEGTFLSVDFLRQLLYIGIAALGGLAFFNIHESTLKSNWFVLGLYGVAMVSLILLLPFGAVVNGSKSWFHLGFFSFQPADLAKFALIIIISKYLATRHRAINSLRTIVVTFIYTVIQFILIFIQPDFGSSIVLLVIWFGMVVSSGISWKYIMSFFGIGFVLFMGLWSFVFKPYQKDRIKTFVTPLSDIRGAGYNAYQSTIAVGSGKAFGKGIGNGTQSRLNFLPEHKTDFIFASFSEEWGFVGSLLVVGVWALLLSRIYRLSRFAMSNFDSLFAIGSGLFFGFHAMVNIGMNVGLVPVTGITLPFMSFGGSHIIVEGIIIGVLLRISRDQKEKQDRFVRS